MESSLSTPNPKVAATVTAAMTQEKVISSTRLPTGEQNFVFAVETEHSSYVIRMTDIAHKNTFIAALNWQNILLPLGIPLSNFIKTDLEGTYSPFPSLLMHRLPGDDLCNVYSTLSDSDKMSLAKEMVAIQSATNSLADGTGYGWAYSYDHLLPDKTWYDFLVNRLVLFKKIIKETAVFDDRYVEDTITLAKSMKGNLEIVKTRPFLWDASERNVMVHKGTVSGIVDVDEICFGDPLFVIGLTHVALAMEGWDSIYTDTWEKLLCLDKKASNRLAFYKLFYVIVFMRKHGINTSNKKQVLFNRELLRTLCEQFYFECLKNNLTL